MVWSSQVRQCKNIICLLRRYVSSLIKRVPNGSGEPSRSWRTRVHLPSILDDVPMEEGGPDAYAKMGSEAEEAAAAAARKGNGGRRTCSSKRFNHKQAPERQRQLFVTLLMPCPLVVRLPPVTPCHTIPTPWTMLLSRGGSSLDTAHAMSLRAGLASRLKYSAASSRCRHSSTGMSMSGTSSLSRLRYQ
jgi:hypothetical protein